MDARFASELRELESRRRGGVDPVPHDREPSRPRSLGGALASPADLPQELVCRFFDRDRGWAVASERVDGVNRRDRLTSRVPGTRPVERASDFA